MEELSSFNIVKGSLGLMLTNIRIVLVNTSHPGNIGSAARAMKTMGLNQLFLVNPQKFPHSIAIDLAAGAEDVLHRACVVDSLDAAIGDCQLVIGSSARPRGIDLPGLTARQCGELVADESPQANIALVFGREHAGLTNEELLKCNYHVTINSNPEYSSLNLAQAVQVLAYECRVNQVASIGKVDETEDKLATTQEMNLFYQHLERVLIDIDFLKPSNPRKLVQRLHRLFNRARLEHLEVNILRGILSNIQRIIANKESG